MQSSYAFLSKINIFCMKEETRPYAHAVRFEFDRLLCFRCCCPSYCLNIQDVLTVLSFNINIYI